MKRALCLVMILSLVSATAWAQEKEKKGGELSDPLEILKKVDAAAKAVKAVKYDVTFESTGTTRFPGQKLKGSVIVAGELIGFTPEKFLMEIRVAVPDSKEVRRLTAGSDGEMFYLVDHQAKKAYEDIDPAVMGSSGQFFRGLAMVEFLHAMPFSDEITGKSRELKGSKVINGVDCYELRVVYANAGAPTAIWCFGKKDFLPRARIDEYTMPDGQKVIAKKTLSKLVVDPKLEKDAFKLKLPAGYTKTDDFAP